ncbi:hypothetical protein FA15DRAFT_693275 [Coprinopsis marcescibilis]|uniref:Uncharacterized protein n=1 Tax=Coprinopsis marcescibilis TaxID=230819 RepID=A0A5C3KZL9_COPMA|nr:hypothetical protein FA15DRAFT_693275 [Coprinopsis marcescibilis]
MSVEAFANAEELFNQAFSAEDPLPRLIELLKEHPTHLALRDLVVAYTEAVEADPARGQRLASALSKLGHSPDAPAISTTDTLDALLNRELADYHFKWAGFGEGPHTWGPENQYLLESNLSGLSLKNRLTSTSDMLAAVDAGLNATPGTSHVQEVVVGTCIQLLLAGSVFASEDAGTYRKTPADVAAKLKKQKEQGTVKDENATHVLELAIAQAEGGLKPETEIDNVYGLLFPDKL